jgi:hypothetical protein
MSLLDGGIQSIFAKAFAGIYLPATLYKRELTDDGEGGFTYADTQHDCRAQVDSATEAMRAAPGFTDTDQAIYVLSGTLDVEPSTNDEIQTARGRFAIASVISDPAASYWLCRGQRA